MRQLKQEQQIHSEVSQLSTQMANKGKRKNKNKSNKKQTQSATKSENHQEEDDQKNIDNNQNQQQAPKQQGKEQLKEEQKKQELNEEKEQQLKEENDKMETKIQQPLGDVTNENSQGQEKQQLKVVQVSEKIVVQIKPSQKSHQSHIQHNPTPQSIADNQSSINQTPQQIDQSKVVIIMEEENEIAISVQQLKQKQNEEVNMNNEQTPDRQDLGPAQVQQDNVEPQLIKLEWTQSIVQKEHQQQAPNPLHSSHLHLQMQISESQQSQQQDQKQEVQFASHVQQIQKQQKLQKIMSESNKLLLPVYQTPNHQSHIQTSSLVQEVLRKQQIELQVKQQRKTQAQPQQKDSQLDKSPLPQPNLDLSKNQSFIFKLRQSRLQSKPQIHFKQEKNRQIDQNNINQPSSFKEPSQKIKCSTITHELISSAQIQSLPKPSSQASVMKFILLSKGDQEKKQHNQHLKVEQQQERHLIRDQTQQRLASEENLKTQQENLTSIIQEQPVDNKKTFIDMEKELDQINNDIQMAKILSNYQSQIESTSSPKPQIICQVSQVEKEEENQFFKKQSAPIQQVMDSAEDQQSNSQSLSNNEINEPSTKVQRIKMFFEMNSKIVEEIDYEQEGNDQALQEDQQLLVEEKIQSKDVKPALMEKIVEQQIVEQEINEQQAVKKQKQKDQYPSETFHLTLNQTPQKLSDQQQQIDFSQYQLKSSINNSPQQNQQNLYVSKEYQDEIDQDRKDESSPVLFKLRASQENMRINHDIAQEEQTLSQGENKAFGLRLQTIEHTYKQDDDLHDPTNSPAIKQSDIETNHNFQLNHQEQVVIHHLGGKHYSAQHAHVTFKLESTSQQQQQSTQIHHHDDLNPHLLLDMQKLTEELQIISTHPIHHLHPPYSPQYSHPHSLTQTTSLQMKQDSQSVQQSGILNKLEEVTSQHMITEKSIQVPLEIETAGVRYENGQMFQGERNEAEQVAENNENEKNIKEEFKKMEYEFLKKIIPQPFYHHHQQPQYQREKSTRPQQHLTQNMKSQQYISVPKQVLTSEPTEQTKVSLQMKQSEIKPTNYTPQRPPQQPQHRVIHSIVRQWDPNINITKLNQEQYYHQIYQSLSQQGYTYSQQQTVSFQSPQRREHNHSHNNQPSSQQPEWKHTHRDTIIDALNDLENSDSQQERREIQNQFYQQNHQPNQQHHPYQHPQYQPSQFNPTILDSFAPLSYQHDQVPLIRTLTAQTQLNQPNNHYGNFQGNVPLNAHNTSSMPFLNNKPSDRYRQFIDDDSAQKQVEQSRTFGVYAVPLVYNCEISSQPLKNQDLSSKTVDDTSSKATNLVPQKKQPSPHSNPSEPKVYTMEEYKKRFQTTYSFTKPKTNIISLDSIQKNTINIADLSSESIKADNGQVLKVEVQRRTVADNVTVGEVKEELKQKSTVSVGRESIFQMNKIQYPQKKVEQQERNVSYQETKLSSQQIKVYKPQQMPHPPPTIHQFTLQQNSETSISPPTVPYHQSSTFKPVTHYYTRTDSIRQSSQQTAKVGDVKEKIVVVGENDKSCSDQSLIDEIIPESLIVNEGKKDDNKNVNETKTIQQPIQIVPTQPITSHLQFFTSYSSNISTKQINHSTSPSAILQQPSTTPSSLPYQPSPLEFKPFISSSPTITIPAFTYSNLQPIIQHNQSPQINQNNICYEKLSRSRERSKEKTKVIFNLSLSRKSSNENKKVDNEKSEKAQERSYELSRILGQKEGIRKQENHQKFNFIPQIPASQTTTYHPVFAQYANYNYYSKQTSKPQPSIKPISHYSPISTKQPSIPQSFNYPNTLSYQQSNTFETGLKGNTNSGSKSRNSQHTSSPSFLNNIYTPQFKLNKISQHFYQPQYSMINPIGQKYDQKLNDSRKSKEFQHLRIYDSRDQKRPESRGKKQKICLTLRRDHIKKSNDEFQENSHPERSRGYSNDPGPYINRKIQHSQQSREKIRPKLKQVKLQRQSPKQQQFSSNILTKEYKEKKFMKIQKFTSQNQKEKPYKDIQSYTNHRKQLIREQPDQSSQLQFTKLFSFLDKPEDYQKQPSLNTKHFTFIEQQKKQQLPSNNNSTIPFMVQKPEPSAKPSTVSKLLAIGKKPQHTFKTEHNPKQPNKISSEYPQTGYKIIDQQPLIMNGFKGFVRSKLTREVEKEIKRETKKSNNLDDSLSDVENEDIPMMNH